MSASTAYLPGHVSAHTRPLARYLPPIPEGIGAAWLKSHFPILNPKEAPGQSPEIPWVLDPFGAAPDLAVEMARAGYQVLVAANNPISRFLLEMASNPPTRDQLKAALAELAATRKGDERLEPHIRSLYLTHCDECGEEVLAEEFLWDRGSGAAVGSMSGAQGAAIGENPVLFARTYHCPHCGESGEHPASQGDIERAAQFSANGLHRARALERVASREDPDRRHVEEAFEAYLPRAVYVLFTLVNKIDSLTATPAGSPSSLQSHPRRLLAALLLTAFDQANTLWPYPTGRARPRQLTIPPRFREKNIWLALEEAVEQWAAREENIRRVHLTVWPEVPQDGGGICLFEGRLKDLVEQIYSSPQPRIHASAVLAAIPRPNQAFWTLSALWAGWLWGREAVGPFKSVLRRRRYDWGWHSTALQSTLENLSPLLESGAPFLGLIGEAEPGFLSAGLIAAEAAGFNLDGIALRPEEGQAQILWRRAPGNGERTVPGSGNQGAATAEDAADAARTYLLERAEPAAFLHVYSAALSALIQSGALREFRINHPGVQLSPAETLTRLNDLLEDAFSYRRGFLRFGGSQKSLEVGQWWLRDPSLVVHSQDKAIPLADRVEVALVNHLLKHPGRSFQEIDTALCTDFPGLFTPDTGLIRVCLDSYGEKQPAESVGWVLRSQDAPKTRRMDIKSTYQTLKNIAKRLGYQTKGRTPLLWIDSDDEIIKVWYIQASSLAGKIILANPYPPQKSLIALPDARANLLAYKIKKDSRLRQSFLEGWRFINFRQLNWLAEHPSLTQEGLEEQLTPDLAEYDDPQMRML